MGRGGRLDRLDVHILRELVWGRENWPVGSDIRKSYGTVARSLGVDEGTVRNRVRALHGSGFIAGWRTILNPSLFGGGEIAVWLDVGGRASKDELFESACLLPGAILINRSHGKGVFVVLRYHDEVEVRREIDLLLRLADAEWRIVGRVPFPSCDLRLTPTDRSILRCIRGDPRRPAVAVSRELGISTRTVRRRLQRMIDHRALFAFPALEPKAVEGPLIGALLVTYRADRKAEIDERILAHLDDFLWHVFHMLPYAPGGLHPCAFNLFLPNLAKAREILIWAHDLPGVVECRLELMEELRTRFEVFDDELEKRLARR